MASETKIDRWKAEYDTLIVRYHSLGLSDFETLNRMLDQNISVAQHDVVAARRRLGLPKNIKQAQVHQSDQLIPKNLPNPLRVAAQWLGSRLVEKPSGYWLDSVPVNLPKIMRETNRLLAAAGIAQVGPEGWRA